MSFFSLSYTYTNTHFTIVTSLMIFLLPGAMIQDALFQCSLDIYLIKVTHIRMNESAPLRVQNIGSPLSSLHRSICDGVHDMLSAVKALVHEHIVNDKESRRERIDIEVVDILGSTISSDSPLSLELHKKKLDIYNTIVLPTLQQSVMKYNRSLINRHQKKQLGEEIKEKQIYVHSVQAPMLSLPMKITENLQFNFDMRSIQNLCKKRNKKIDNDNIDFSDAELVRLFLDVSCPLISTASSPAMNTSHSFALDDISYSFGAQTESQCMYISHTLRLLDKSFARRAIPISGKWRSALLELLRRRLIESYEQLYEKRRQLKMTYAKQELNLHCLIALQEVNKAVLMVDNLLGNENKSAISAAEHSKISLPFKLAIIKGEMFLDNENRWRG